MKLLDKIFIRDKKINEYNLRDDREVTMCINDITELFIDNDMESVHVPYLRNT